MVLWTVNAVKAMRNSVQYSIEQDRQRPPLHRIYNLVWKHMRKIKYIHINDRQGSDK